jgi:TldD protein
MLRDDLDALTDVGATVADRARRGGVHVVWRAQAHASRHVVVREGRTETASVQLSSGQGIHVVTAEGRTALASRDDFRPEPAIELFDRALALAQDGERLGVEPSPLPPLEPTTARVLSSREDEFDAIDLATAARRLTELERALAARVSGVRLRLSFRAELEAWRIVRDDGTDVTFDMPRCTLVAKATGEGQDDSRHGVTAQVFDPAPGMLDDEPTLSRFLRRLERAALLARDLPDAPPHPAGSFPLVIDYALAKGLAHEAFGHAAEADGFRSSILAAGGRFRTGLPVGPTNVSIVDEPVAGDHAWQPFSANGIRRDRAVIVDHGMLRDALSDPWSAGPGGVRLTGAERAQSFAQAPLPRMSNIRIEVDDPLPAPGAFEDYGPEEVRDLLATAGVLSRHPRIVYLSGYGGGQVNTTSGDFVFQCKAIWVLGRDGVTFHKPAIFSGSMFGALQSVREAFGPLALDAIGQCGKWGQSVPSSGGSHWFLVLDPHPAVRLGGR